MHTHTHVFLIQFSVTGHWDCFLVLATEKRAALNIGGACIFANWSLLQTYAQEWACRIT